MARSSSGLLPCYVFIAGDHCQPECHIDLVLTVGWIMGRKLHHWLEGKVWQHFSKILNVLVVPALAQWKGINFTKPRAIHKQVPRMLLFAAMLSSVHSSWLPGCEMKQPWNCTHSSTRLATSLERETEERTDHFAFLVLKLAERRPLHSTVLQIYQLHCVSNTYC